MNRVRRALAIALMLSGPAVTAAQEHTSPPPIPVQVGIDPRAVSEALAIDAETALVDRAKSTVSTTFNQDEIQNLPTGGRNFLDIALTAPGVLSDRVSVGGNHAGTDYSIVNMGTPVQGNQFLIDGVNVDNPSALGVSGTYIDPYAVEEIRVQTGGLSAEYGTTGSAINTVLRQGMSNWTFSADYAHTPGNTPTTAPPLNYNLTGANEYGASFGGPLVRNKGFFFGGYGRNSGNYKFDEAGDWTDEELKQQYLYAKSNWSLAPGQRFYAFYYNNGRDLSGLPTIDRKPDSVWQTQADAFQLGARYEFVKNPKFGLSAQYSRFSHPVTQTPQGGLNTSTVRTSSGIYQGSYALFDSDRAQNQLKLTGVLTRQENHTLTFGVNYRATEANTNVRWANDQIIFQGATTAQAFTAYPSESWFATQNGIMNAFAEKRVTWDKVTIYGGVNFFSESGTVGPNRFLANPRDNLVTGATEDQRDQWKDVKTQPRFGLRYSLGADDGTTVSFNYGQYASYGGAFNSGYQSVVETNGSDRGAIYRDFLNRPFVAGPQMGTSAFGLPDNEIDPDLSTPDTQELLFGIEHALLPEFVVGLNLTWRTTTNPYVEVDLVDDNGVRRPATANDYVFDQRFSGTVPNGPAYAVDVFSHRQPASPRLGSYLTNADADMNYSGASLTFNKRLANRWMLRGNFTWHDWTWSDDVSPDPTPLLGIGRADEAITIDSPDSAKQGVYINSRYQYDVQGLYQLAPDRPWGFNVSAHMYGRQGYPINPYFQVTRDDGRSASVQVTPSSEFRYGNVNLADIGVRKPLDFGAGRMTVNFDCFNCLGADTELQRQNNIQQPQRTLETIAPRTIRLGVRFTF